MTRDILILKMPFRTGHWVIEREVPFLFKIMTLELIADYLKIPLEKIFEEETVRSEKMTMAIIWCGYLAACKELYHKPKYKEAHAEKWNEYMQKATRDKLMVDVSIMLGGLTKNGEGKEPVAGEKKK
jgi:hypothetical protein